MHEQMKTPEAAMQFDYMIKCATARTIPVVNANMHVSSTASKNMLSIDDPSCPLRRLKRWRR